MYRKNNAGNNTSGSNKDNQNIAAAIKTHGFIVAVAFFAIVAITWVLSAHGSGLQSEIKVRATDGKYQGVIEGHVSPPKK